jgi:hypothetical protein
MRLLKLLAYSLLGYVLYELYLGMTEGAESRLRASPQGRARTGQGRKVGVQDAGGGQSTRNVGRGVVH